LLGYLFPQPAQRELANRGLLDRLLDVAAHRRPASKQTDSETQGKHQHRAFEMRWNAVTAGDVAWLTRGDSGESSEVAIRAKDKPLRALLFAGRPLHEAVVARGPFVMNTEGEIEQAYADYRAGRFSPF
jgi:redox-sensitive bicupin YhaK (pirin superfamily)